MPFLDVRGLTRCCVLAALASAGCPSDPADPAADAGSDAEMDSEDGETDGSDAEDAAADAQAGADAGAHDAGPCKVTAPTACPKPPTRYGDVVPIIEKRCLSCHDGLHEQWPLTTYQHVADWYDQIRDQMLNCTMPPSDSDISMTLDERETILRWIRCGYPE